MTSIEWEVQAMLNDNRMYHELSRQITARNREILLLSATGGVAIGFSLAVFVLLWCTR